MSEIDSMEAMMRAAADTIEQLKDAEGELAEIRGEGEAADGKIQVTVQPGGAVESLEIDPKAMRMPSTDLAEAIIEAIGIASADAIAKGKAVMEGIIPGAGSKIMEMTGTTPTSGGPASEDTVNSIVESLRGGIERRA